VRDGWLVIDHEPSAIRRLLRPISPRLGIRVGELMRERIMDVSDDAFVTESFDFRTDDDGNRIGEPHIRYTRATAD
jgi:hypothetical protein